MIVKIADLGDIVTGKTPTTKDALNFGYEYPFITPGDLQSTKHILRTERALSQSGAQLVKNCIIPPNSICVSCIGNFGYIGMTTRRSVTNQQINSIIVKKEYDSDFVYYLMKSLWPLFKHLEGQSTTLSILNKTLFSNIEVDVPTLNAQRFIAATLSCLDDKIELNTRIIANLEAQAQAIFKSWFVDFEPFQDGEFVDSELGMIPKGWRVGVLSDIAEITMGQSPIGESFNENEIGTVFYQGRAEFGYRFPTRRLFTTAPTRMAQSGDILLSVRAPVGDINVATEACCIGRGLSAIHSSNRCQSYLLYFVKQLHDVLDQFNGEGTVFGSINRKDLNQLAAIIPPLENMQQFEEVVGRIDAEIMTLHKENALLITTRDTLLPKLMSGEIEVPVEG